MTKEGCKANVEESLKITYKCPRAEQTGRGLSRYAGEEKQFSPGRASHESTRERSASPRAFVITLAGLQRRPVTPARVRERATCQRQCIGGDASIISSVRPFRWMLDAHPRSNVTRVCIGGRVSELLHSDSNRGRRVPRRGLTL